MANILNSRNYTKWLTKKCNKFTNISWNGFEKILFKEYMPK